jgi:galactitol PTS system EIIC component
MEILQDVFGYISNLGSFVMIPIMITIVGLLVKLRVDKALKAGIVVGVGLIGLDIVLGIIWNHIGPVANLFVEMFDLSLTTIDVGWGAAAGLAFSTVVGSFIIPFIIVLNIIMLTLKATKTVNIDIWNYWHYAFTGAVVYTLTNNLVYAFVAAAAHAVISLKIADITAPTVQEALGIPGISIPQGYAVSTVPIYMVLDKVYDAVLPRKKNEKHIDSDQLSFLSVLQEPVFLGMIIGIALAVAVGYGVPQALRLGMQMAALMYLLPRVTKIIMEGLLPISTATREFMQKKYQGEEFYIGLDSAVLLGLPTTVSVGLLLIPITLALSAIIPFNTTIPLGDLAATAFFISMATPIHKGSFVRTLISGTFMMGIVLSIASFFAPILTSFAQGGGVNIPEGAVQITGLSAGNLIAFALYMLSSLGVIGVVLIVGLCVAFLYFTRTKKAK